MNDKKLRKRLEKIRNALSEITKQINGIYNDNAENDQDAKGEGK